MEVSIRDCPACGAVVMGDETRCNTCGKDLPVSTPPKRSVETSGPSEAQCPRCGMTVPRGVLRCRDCGAYMSADIEAAMLAKQVNRAFAPVRTGGLVGGGAAFGTGFLQQSQAPSSFAEVANDDDFDLNPSVDMVDSAAPAIGEYDAPAEAAPPGTQSDDDFEMGGFADYSVQGGAATEAPAGSEGAPAEPATEAPDAAATEPAATGDVAAPDSLRASQSGPDVDHSVQTAGDVLLDAALEEERDAQGRARGEHRRLKRSANSPLPAGRFLVFCPNGHRIQVHDKHRGRTGRCPNCKSLFFVPAADVQELDGAAGGTEAAGEAAAAAPPKSGYSQWVTDVLLHRLNPAKLKLKPGSLAAEYEPVDLGAGAEHLLLAVLFTGGGPFRAMQEPKKKVATRQAMLDHLGQQMPLADLPVPKHYPLTVEQLQQLKIVQPAVPGEESMFADVPVFGEGRIAVRLPAADASGERAFLSFTLSQFRLFSQILAEQYGLAEFGAGTEIPLTDNLQEVTCHYSETVLNTLVSDRMIYYRSDPAIKLTILGRRCEKCGLVVSEDSRKKEKIGGKSDASIAKAPCPKCKQKFGNIVLYGLQS